jgi:hypothetical protein
VATHPENVTCDRYNSLLWLDALFLTLMSLGMSDDELTDLIHASDMGSTSSRPELERYSTSTALKRRASPTFEGLQDATSRKRLKGDAEDQTTNQTIHDQLSVDGQALLEDLAQELQCGCCAGLVYRPVTVSPCQHFLCGR